MKVYIPKITGMDIYYDSTSKNIMHNEKPAEKSIRCLKDIKEVVYDKTWTQKTNPERKMYYMSRNIYEEQDKESIINKNLRYDITVIPPDLMGCEYVKTLGHRHPNIPKTDISYTEIYQVLNGCAIFIIEKTENKKTEFIHIHAKVGEIVIVPPNYSHITINPSNEILIISNWVADNFKSDYRQVIKTHGLAYYYIKKDTEDVWISNPNYKNETTIKQIEPVNPELIGLKKDEPLYNLIKTQSHLEFLNEPQKYETLFKKVLSQ
ncbi:MAG: glucose-6-phosphate isomerase family protein [archaeon]|nr:glucose-6-phosphate isomerase family protein [archaeon]